MNGRYFHTVIIGRELLQMTPQTIQAIRMSKYLSRVLLNRFYVVLVAINCWSNLFVYSRWFWRDEARRRFVVILCDCLLNIMSTLGVTFIVFCSNVDFYQAKIIGFDFSMIGDQEWFAQMLNDAQMVIVVSWFDMMSRITFSLGLVASAADLKDLLRCDSIRRNRITNAGGYAIDPTNPGEVFRIDEAQIINPTGASGSQDNTNAVILQDLLQQAQHKQNRRKPRRHLGVRAIKGTHAVFAAWGLVVVSLHVHAAMKRPLFECAPKVHPMGNALPSCYVVNFNCYYLGISGTITQVEIAWSKFDRMTVTKSA